MLDKIHGIIERTKVVLTQAVTYITLATVVITGALATVTPQLPEDVAAQVAGYGATVVAFLLGAAAVIRRVTPVAKADRGILPK